MANDQSGSEEQHLLGQIETIFERRQLTSEERETVISAVTTLLLMNVARWQSADEIKHELTDPRRWARIALDTADFVRTLESSEFAQGTFGAWIKQAIEEEAKRETGKVVDIEPRRQGDPDRP
jgi:hypothetical protein